MTDNSLFDRPVLILVRKIATVVRTDLTLDCLRFGRSLHNSANWALSVLSNHNNRRLKLETGHQN